MDFHLNSLLNLPNTTVFTCYKEVGFTVLYLQLINEGINCPNCQNYTDIIHQTSETLIRDLSIFGAGVYLKVPRRKFYCNNCQKYPTEQLSWVENKQRFTQRYQEYIYERVKESSCEQVSRMEDLSADQVQRIFNRSPVLAIAHELKEELRHIYQSNLTVKGGLRAIKKWLISARIVLEYAANTLENHLPEIADYFISRTTSSVTEGINTRIKLILRQSYGFKSFNLMREKLLACLLK